LPLPRGLIPAWQSLGANEDAAKQLGVQLEVRAKPISKKEEIGAYLDQMASGAFGMYLLGWHPDYLETSNFLGPWTTDGPESMGTYFNHHPNYQAYKEIMNVARATVDTVKRASLYKAIQILSTQDVPWIPLWSMTDEMVTARLPGVQGLKLDVTMDIDIWNIFM